MCAPKTTLSASALNWFSDECRFAEQQQQHQTCIQFAAGAAARMGQTSAALHATEYAGSDCSVEEQLEWTAYYGAGASLDDCATGHSSRHWLNNQWVSWLAPAPEVSTHLHTFSGPYRMPSAWETFTCGYRISSTSCGKYEWIKRNWPVLGLLFFLIQVRNPGALKIV